MAFEFFYHLLADWSYSLVEFLGYEFVVSMFFSVDENNRIKFTFDFGFSQFRSTILYLAVMIPMIIIWSKVSDSIYEPFVTTLETMMLRTVPVFIALTGFIGFWLSKVLLGREWDNKAVIGSLIMIGISVFILLFMLMI